MDLQLGGRTALITGGSRGIGKAIARTLLREGALVVIAARTAPALAATARELAAETGQPCLAIPADTGDDASVRQLVEQTVAALGRVDILVNAAAQPGGQAPAPRFHEISGDLFREEMNVKVLGYLRCAQAVAPHMQRHGWGRIINLGGLAARQSGSAMGSMRNVAVAALTKNLADELGPHGITVTVVHPGTTVTEQTPRVLAETAAREGTTPEAVAQRIGSGNALRRMITAEEIADVVAFLASPRSVAINGDAIVVGGGVGRGIYY